MIVKVCLISRWLLLVGFVAVLCLPATLRSVTAVGQENQPPAVTLRWGSRAGVSRYRLQLANDPSFSDIVFDRVVSGHEYRLTDLLPGRYYWRVASLNAKRGEFSSAGVIEVPPKSVTNPPSPTPRANPSPSTNTIVSRGGWYAAIGNVARSVIAHLRAPGSSEIVAATTDGRVVALDATRGIALWTIRPSASRPAGVPHLLSVRAPSGADNILVLNGSLATLIEGRTGRELWRTTLAGNAVAAAVSPTRVFVLDNSLRKISIIETNGGTVISKAVLPRRVVGAPVVFTYRGTRAVIVALEDGGVHAFDESGKTVVSTNAGSPATTSPLVLTTGHGELVLVGTRNGLTALTADELRPLGRVALNGDAPRGTLTAHDIDGDGRPEAIMFTERGRVLVVKSDEGKILWEADARRAESAAFADVNRDGVLDLWMAGREGLAFALSGRDGSLVWKDESAPNVATNHAPAAAPRATFAIPSASGILVIAADANRTGLRAIEFPKR